MHPLGIARHQRSAALTFGQVGAAFIKVAQLLQHPCRPGLQCYVNCGAGKAPHWRVQQKQAPDKLGQPNMSPPAAAQGSGGTAGFRCVHTARQGWLAGLRQGFELCQQPRRRRRGTLVPKSSYSGHATSPIAVSECQPGVGSAGGTLKVVGPCCGLPAALIAATETSHLV